MFSTVYPANNMKFAHTASGGIFLLEVGHFLKIIFVVERRTDLAWRAAAVFGKKKQWHSPHTMFFFCIARLRDKDLRQHGRQLYTVQSGSGNKGVRPSSAKRILLRSKQWPMPNGSYCILILLSSQFPRRSAESVRSGPAIVAPEIPTGFGRKGRGPATSLAAAGGHPHVVHQPTDVRPLGHRGRPRVSSAWAVRLVRLVDQLTPAPRTTVSNENNKPRTPPIHG